MLLLGRGRAPSGPRRIVVPDPRRPATPPAAVAAVVVGGGLAGFAAATVLSERGVRVQLVEAAEQVGGRLAAWPYRLPDGTVHTVEHGFHGFFRQYYNLQALLRRVDPQLGFLRPVDDYRIHARHWPAESLAKLPPAPPWNLIALCLRSPSLSLRDLRDMDGAAALPLLAYDSEDTYRDYDDISAAELLDRIGFPDRARALLFDVFAHSFFNLEQDMSAAEMVMLFHFYFLGNPNGLLFDAPDEDYAACIWRPLVQRLQARGGSVATGTAALSVEAAGDGWAVHCSGGSVLPGRHLVLALDVPGLKRLVEASPDLQAAAPALTAQVAGMRPTNPYAVSRLWLDGDVAADRASFTSVSREATLDSITLYHRIEREAIRWAAVTGGSVLELHAYAAPFDVPAEQLHRRMVDELTRLWPEVGRRRVVAADYRVGAQAPAFPVGASARRPSVVTDAPGIRLAGDGLALPFPSALMERAVASGFLAANDILTAEGAAPEPVLAVRERGLLAGRRLARAAAR